MIRLLITGIIASVMFTQAQATESTPVRCRPNLSKISWLGTWRMVNSAGQRLSEHNHGSRKDCLEWAASFKDGFVCAYITQNKFDHRIAIVDVETATIKADFPNGDFRTCKAHLSKSLQLKTYSLSATQAGRKIEVRPLPEPIGNYIASFERTSAPSFEVGIQGLDIELTTVNANCRVRGKAIICGKLAKLPAGTVVKPIAEIKLARLDRSGTRTDKFPDYVTAQMVEFQPAVVGSDGYKIDFGFIPQNASAYN